MEAHFPRSVLGGVERASLRPSAFAGRGAKERLIVAVELLRALVAHGVGGGIDVAVASKEELLRFVKPKALLILQGRERREGLEVPVKGRWSHTRHGGEFGHGCFRRSA